MASRNITEQPTSSQSLSLNDCIKPIPGTKGYLVDSSGGVWSTQRRESCKTTGKIVWVIGEPRQIKTHADSRGRKRVELRMEDGGVRKFFVHRLVLSVFVGDCPDGNECCHQDGNTKNNALGNLRWDSHIANCQDKVRHGTYLVGKDLSWTKLDANAVRAVRVAYNNGVRMSVLAEVHGVTAENIAMIVKRKTWRHV